METTKDRKITAFRLRTSLLERLKLDAKRDAHSPAVAAAGCKRKPARADIGRNKTIFTLSCKIFLKILLSLPPETNNNVLF